MNLNKVFGFYSTDNNSRESLGKNEKAIQAWIYEVKYSEWSNANELKLKYKNASIISSKRVVFNIKGHEYRLIVDIEYKLRIVFILWFGTHKEYDKIDAKEVEYESESN